MSKFVDSPQKRFVVLMVMLSVVLASIWIVRCVDGSDRSRPQEQEVQQEASDSNSEREVQQEKAAVRTVAQPVARNEQPETSTPSTSLDEGQVSGSVAWCSTQVTGIVQRTRLESGTLVVVASINIPVEANNGKGWKGAHLFFPRDVAALWPEINHSSTPLARAWELFASTDFSSVEGFECLNEQSGSEEPTPSSPAPSSRTTSSSSSVSYTVDAEYRACTGEIVEESFTRVAPTVDDAMQKAQAEAQQWLDNNAPKECVVEITGTQDVSYTPSCPEGTTAAGSIPAVAGTVEATGVANGYGNDPAVIARAEAELQSNLDAARDEWQNKVQAEFLRVKADGVCSSHEEPTNVAIDQSAKQDEGSRFHALADTHTVQCGGSAFLITGFWSQEGSQGIHVDSHEGLSPEAADAIVLALANDDQATVQYLTDEFCEQELVEGGAEELTDLRTGETIKVHNALPEGTATVEETDDTATPDPERVEEMGAPTPNNDPSKQVVATAKASDHGYTAQKVVCNEGDTSCEDTAPAAPQHDIDPEGSENRDDDAMLD